MDCTAFRDWLSNRDPAGCAAKEPAEAHAGTCPACARLLALDRVAEGALGAALARPPLPAGLAERVSLQARGARAARPRRRWPLLAVPTAAAAALLLVMLAPGPRLTGVDQVARLAAQNHQARMAAQFSAAEVEDAAAWFRGRLAFDARLPATGTADLTLTGGRKCSLGRAEAAYLFYDRDGKRVSLFEVPADEIEAGLEEGELYRYPTQGLDVRLWREGDRAFVMVE